MNKNLDMEDGVARARSLRKDAVRAKTGRADGARPWGLVGPHWGVWIPLDGMVSFRLLGKPPHTL